MTDPTNPARGEEFPPTEPFTPPSDEELDIAEQPTAPMASPFGPQSAPGAVPETVAGPAAEAAAATAWTIQPIVVDAARGPQEPRGARGSGGGARRRPSLADAIRRHPKSWIAAGATAAVLVIGGGSFAAGAAIPPQPDALVQPVQTRTSDASPSQSASATASATPTPTPTTRPTGDPAAPATALKTCSVAGPASDGRLGTLEAQVVDTKTGQVLFDRNGSTPAPTASVLKTITAAAALASLGPDYRISTTVVKGSQPGQLVLVGGGDPTLSAGNGSYFQGAPTLDALAQQAKAAWTADPANAGQPITSVVADSSLFGGPMWQPSWDEHEERVVQGSTAYISALMADGDKQNPKALESPRGTDPAGDAGKAFAQDLGVQYAGAGTAPQGAAPIATVQSQPVSTLLNEALLDSDNTVMEMLARLTAIKEGAGNTFDAIDAGDKAALASYGLNASGLKIVDGSGLSADNAVPPSFLTQFMIKVLNRDQGLGLVYDSLPVAGKTGTLAAGYGRFTGAAAVAAGHVHAKTGWIDGGYTLSGIVDAKDGSELSFAIFALGNVGDSAKAAIDALTAAIYNCGGNLSNS